MVLQIKMTKPTDFVNSESHQVVSYTLIKSVEIDFEKILNQYCDISL